MQVGEIACSAHLQVLMCNLTFPGTEQVLGSQGPHLAVACHNALEAQKIVVELG